jgi:hypothetical protein
VNNNLNLHHWLYLQLVQLSGGRPGRDLAGEIPAQHPPHPPDVFSGRVDPTFVLKALWPAARMGC